MNAGDLFITASTGRALAIAARSRDRRSILRQWTVSGTGHHGAAGNKPDQKTDTGNNNGDGEQQTDFHMHPER